jgi:hypothetical protein
VKTLFILFGLVAILLTGCTTDHPKPKGGEKIWKYDHERTKDKIEEIYSAAGKELTDTQLDKMVAHFKKYPPELRLNHGNFEMVRLIKKTGSFSGEYKMKGSRMILFCGGEDCGWDIHYDKKRDEFTVIFIAFPIVLSR